MYTRPYTFIHEFVEGCFLLGLVHQLECTEKPQVHQFYVLHIQIHALSQSAIAHYSSFLL